MHTERIDALWRAGDVDVLFSGELTRPTSWASAGRSKRYRDADPDALAAAIDCAPVLREVDPRDLRATQPSVTRAGVAYYLSNTYYACGRTFADYHRRVNRYPVVYRRDDGQSLIISGHHRASAALLRGRPLLARVASGPRGPERGVHVAPRSIERAEPARTHIAPLLTAGAPPRWDHALLATADQAYDFTYAGTPCHLGDAGTDDVLHLLTRLGLTHAEARAQLTFADTGDIHT